MFLQPEERSLKQTVLRTSPSSTVGWAAFNQPDQSVPHLYAGTRVVGIFVPAAPTKRYHPSTRWSSHTSCFCSFYWHHSGFDDNNMGRLVNEINITKKGCSNKDNLLNQKALKQLACSWYPPPPPSKNNSAGSKLPQNAGPNFDVA